jgi:hypothetical protein
MEGCVVFVTIGKLTESVRPASRQDMPSDQNSYFDLKDEP